MNGAFRDGSAAIERALMLERENLELRRELDDLARLRVENGELMRLRHENAALRAAARGENEDAYMRRVLEENDEMTRELRRLRRRIAEQADEIAANRRALARVLDVDSFTGGLANHVQTMLDWLSRRREEK